MENTNQTQVMMQTAESGIFNCEYPQFAFAFNPIPLFLRIKDSATQQQADAKAKIIIKVITPKGDELRIEREFYARKLVVDLSAAARMFFDRNEFHKLNFKDETLLKDLQFEVYAGSETVANKIFTISIPVLWGAMQLGEIYSQSKKFRAFKGYPFTLPLFLTKITNNESDPASVSPPYLQFILDGKLLADKEALEGAGKYNIDISQYINNVDNQVSAVIDMGEYTSTFDYTFDYTFRGFGKDSVRIDVEVESVCEKNLCYLRWINSYGEYNYWLFRKSVHTSQIEDHAVRFDQFFSTTNYTENYHAGVAKPVSKNIQKTVMIYADLINSDDYEFLLGLAQSPVVDQFMGYDEQNNSLWMSVNIQPASFAKSTEHLQDIAFNLSMPQTFIQSL